MIGKHGGARAGAGRPALEDKRKMRSMRAHDDEWELIQKFAGFVKEWKRLNAWVSEAAEDPVECILQSKNA